ncbi:hypothetical protein [Streptomyces sp. 196(2019)]|uniref:hypothetical protein n=2 Tax=Streptomyces TaxID=1883 RepID=UPI0013EBABF6|nr:hypothetical protein [Streptomyces sp. 196(2019)]NGO86713.1 hypothetical protein [Streptomyces sp. 196(2019)]
MAEAGQLSLHKGRVVSPGVSDSTVQRTLQQCAADRFAAVNRVRARVRGTVWSWPALRLGPLADHRRKTFHQIQWLDALNRHHAASEDRGPHEQADWPRATVFVTQWRRLDQLTDVT